MCSLPSDALLARVFKDNLRLAASGVRTWAWQVLRLLRSVSVPVAGLSAQQPCKLDVEHVTSLLSNRLFDWWTNLPQDPRTCPSDVVKRVTYLRWFGSCGPHATKYLSLPISPNKSRCMAQFRLGSHMLAVETGRWTNPRAPRHMRFCQICASQVVEDEKHILLECPAYAHIRASTEFAPLLGRCGVSMQALFGDSDVYAVACFVHACCAYRIMLVSYQEDESVSDLASLSGWEFM